MLDQQLQRDPRVARVTGSPTVEVLIVSYNTRDLLEACLRSISRYAPDPAVAQVRVAVLDNDSPDGSADMVEQRYPEVRLVRSRENLGYARGNNVLAESSDADYLLLLNPDTEWTGDVVAPLLERLQSSPRALAVSARLRWPDGGLQASAARLPTVRYDLAQAVRGSRIARVGTLWDAEKIIERNESIAEGIASCSPVPWLWATCLLLRRDDVSAFGLFDHERFDSYDSDLDFCLRMRQQGREFLYDPAVEVIHVGGASASMAAKKKKERQARRRYYLTHHGALVASVYAVAEPAARGAVRGLRVASRVAHALRGDRAGAHPS